MVRQLWSGPWPNRVEEAAPGVSRGAVAPQRHVAVYATREAEDLGSAGFSPPAHDLGAHLAALGKHELDVVLTRW